MIIRSLIFIIFLSLLSVNSKGQEFIKGLFDDNYDSLYYNKYNDRLISKIYLVRRYVDFTLSDRQIEKDLKYKSDPRFSIGYGASYKWLGLDIEIGLPGKVKGLLEEPESFDIQTQLNFRKFTINFYTGLYSGYYLGSRDQVFEESDAEHPYIRPDIQSQSYGLSGYYVFNSNRYSNLATFTQSEWQKRSAGSLLAGATIFYNNVTADSSLIPSNIIYDSIFHATDFNRTGYFAMGGNLGYAFTFVLWKHWFVDATVLGGLTTGFTSVYTNNNGEINRFRFGVTILSKFGLGYNSKHFYAGLNVSSLTSTSPLPIPGTDMGIQAGIVKFLIAYRFNVDRNRYKVPHWLPIKL